MSSRTSMEETRAGHEKALEPRIGCGHHRGPDRFFGLETEEMSPRLQAAAALAVITPVALSGLFLITLAPGFWWIFTTYFWLMFPAFGLLARGVSGLLEDRPGSAPSPNSKEQELLEALQREGELTPARTAMETSLSVAEADRMLKELAEGGHLEVRVRGGGLFYALWGAHAGAEKPGR